MDQTRLLDQKIIWYQIYFIQNSNNMCFSAILFMLQAGAYSERRIMHQNIMQIPLNTKTQVACNETRLIFFNYAVSAFKQAKPSSQREPVMSNCL